MAKTATTDQEVELMNTKNYGVQIEEVNFTEFERRKTPRIGTYASFVEYIEGVKVQPVLIEIICR